MDVVEWKPVGEMECARTGQWIRIKRKSISVVVIHLARIEFKWIKALITWLNPHCVLPTARHVLFWQVSAKQIINNNRSGNWFTHWSELYFIFSLKRLSNVLWNTEDHLNTFTQLQKIKYWENTTIMSSIIGCKQILFLLSLPFFRFLGCETQMIFSKTNQNYHIISSSLDVFKASYINILSRSHSLD